MAYLQSRTICDSFSHHNWKYLSIRLIPMMKGLTGYSICILQNNEKELTGILCAFWFYLAADFFPCFVISICRSFFDRQTVARIWLFPSATLFWGGRRDAWFEDFRLPLFFWPADCRQDLTLSVCHSFWGGRRNVWFEDFRLPTIFRAADGTLVHKASIRSESGVPKR